MHVKRPIFRVNHITSDVLVQILSVASYHTTQHNSNLFPGVENDSELQKVDNSIYLPTTVPFFAQSDSAASTMSFRWMTLGPLFTALQVKTTFGLQSIILWERDSDEKPAKTT